jgi:hypothetical protein
MNMRLNNSIFLWVLFEVVCPLANELELNLKIDYPEVQTVGR